MDELTRRRLATMVKAYYRSKDSMTDKHTPGPWKVAILDGDTYINPDRQEGEFALIARIHQKGHPANARLIAAAPEILEALEELMTSLSPNPHAMDLAKVKDDTPAIGDRTTWGVLRRARAAIKAVKGDA